MLALEKQNAFFFGGAGAVTGMGFGIGLAALLAWWQLRQRVSWMRIAQNLTPLWLPLVDLLDGSFHPWRGPVLLASSLILALFFSTTRTSSGTDRTISRRIGLALCVGLPLLIYLPDLSPYVGRADTFEFQVVAPQLGIAHPSGYPLYILIGKLFSILPVGSPAWRVNLSSAVFAALAAGMLFLTLCEITTQHRVISTFAALTLAFSPTLWSRAIEAEVYALNTFLVTLGLWLATHGVTGKSPTAKVLPAFGLLTGVAMASHITLGALALMILPLLLNARPRLKFRTWLHTAALGITGLLLYLYIPLRWPAVNHGEWMSPAHFLRFITNAESGGALHPLAFVQDPGRWRLVFRLLQLQIGWVGLALAATGFIYLLRRHRALGAGSVLAFSAWVWFNLSFYVADPDYSAFLIPGHTVLIFWAGLGMQRLSAWAYKTTSVNEQRIPALVPHIVLSACALLPLSRLWVTGPTLDTLAVGKSDEAWARYALRQELASGAAILADSEKFPPLYYLQQIEGLRPDLELVTLFSETQYREALETRLSVGQRVYLARYLPGMDAFGARSVGPLVEVAPPPTVSVEIPTDAPCFGDTLVLQSHRLEIDPEARPMHHLRLTWQVAAKPQQDLTVRIRLRSEGDGSIAWERPATRPVNGYTTTQAWHEGQCVEDYHALIWPAWLPAERYVLEIGVFPQFTEQGLTWNKAGHVWFPLQVIDTPAVSPSAPMNQQTNQYFAGAGLWLKGADLPGEVWASTQLAVDLLWSRQTPSPDMQMTPIFRWVPPDTDDEVTYTSANSVDVPLVQGQYLRRYTLTAPGRTGRYRLDVGIRNDYNSQTLFQARCSWLAKEYLFCPLGEVTVGNAGRANFNDHILLLEATVQTEGVAASGPLLVDLDWRCLRSVEKDYTVFVQVIGPDGKLYGQVDGWPVQGTRPTSGWIVGEEIHDPYQLYLKPDAPAGPYNIIVGWYLLADMSRLPVLDQQGYTTGDSYTIGEFILAQF